VESRDKPGDGTGAPSFTPLHIYPVEFVEHSTGTILWSAAGGFNRGGSSGLEIASSGARK